MGLLNDAMRRLLWSKFMKDISIKRQEIAITKLELREAINAIDVWVENNQANFNSSLPIEARTKLTAVQKAFLLAFVATKKAEVIDG